MIGSTGRKDTDARTGLPRRTVESLLEASENPAPVPPTAATAHRSRLGPAGGGGLEVFHLACRGKYFDEPRFPLRDILSHTQVDCIASETTEISSLPNIPLRGYEAFHIGDRISGDSAYLAAQTHQTQRLPENRLDHAAHPSLGRNTSGILEAPDPLTTVEPLQPAFISRPGPVCGSGDGVFQTASSGKYDPININSSADSFPASSLSLDRPDRTPASHILAYYQNVGGMNSCTDDYLLSCSDECYDIIALTETWLNEGTLSTQVIGTNYNVFRTDRSPANSRKSIGGGVLLAVHRRFDSCLVDNISGKCVEQVWVQIRLARFSLYFCVVYLPPDRTRDMTLIDAHTNSLRDIAANALPTDEFVIVGDYNFSSLKWRSCSDGFLFPDPGMSSFHDGINSMLDCYSVNLLRQINPIVNENNRILDLCFVSNTDYAPKILVPPHPLVKNVRHHPPLHLTLEAVRSSTDDSACDVVSYNFKKADYRSIMDFLTNINWTETLDNENVNLAAQTFSNILNYAIDRHVPKRMHSKTKFQPWQTSELRRLKTSKRAALKRYARHGGYVLRQKYAQISRIYKRTVKRNHADYLRNVQRRLKSDPRSFWKHVNDQRKESGLPSTMRYGQRTASCIQDVCQLFARKFASVFSSEDLTQSQIFLAANNVPPSNQSLNHIDVSDSAILTAIAKMKSSSSAGPDGIPAILIKECRAVLLAPLRQLFRLSLATGVFPSLWKSSYMFPVYKKGDKKLVDNYRGITSICTVAKLFERVILEPVFNHSKTYIAMTQHGFMPQRSTATNLLSFTSYVTDAMSKGLQTDAIYTDLSAAFDKINHAITIAKLERLGFGNAVLNWFRSYLSNRCLTVKIGDSTSHEFSASSGIPQGSHLGPLIFLLYFNDVNFSIKGPRLSFADDLKIFIEIRNQADACFLQRQLTTFAEWCTVNRMSLNPDKCSVVTFTRKQTPFRFNYQLAGKVLNRVGCVKDLGVYLDEQLTFKQHLSYIVTKASRCLGFIMRIAKSFTDIYCLKSLYCSLVRSTLEYCSVIWNPHYLNGVHRIETIQRRFVRFALRLLPWNNPQQLPSYDNRRLLIGLDSLQVRRNLARAMLVSDILNSNIDCPALLSALNIHVQSRALRNNVFFRTPLRRTNYGAHGAIIGLQRTFNRLSPGFDFHLSRTKIKNNFLSILRSH